MNEQNTDNQHAIIEDLTVDEATETEVKGGPVVMEDVLISSYQHSSHASNHNEAVSEDQEAEAATERLEDLPVNKEQSLEVAGGCNPILSSCGVGGNHNETLAEDQSAQNAEPLPLTDLPPDEASEAEIVGGMLLPAVQKVREASATTTGAHSSGGGGGAGKAVFQDIHF
ncbi:MAG: hypothetical protein JST85_10640 [Acidobacteria bacterium]|nr:hypothetical protein [Acidobacteriota bacterium]